MTKLIKANADYLPETFDDQQLVAHLRSMFAAAEAKRKQRKRMLYLCAFLFCVTFASFVVRYWR